MTFGRPAAVPDDYVKIAMPVVFDDTSSLMEYDSVCFFNATM